jgi:hypothetical protein
MGVSNYHTNDGLEGGWWGTPFHPLLKFVSIVFQFVQFVLTLFPFFRYRTLWSEPAWRVSARRRVR